MFGLSRGWDQTKIRLHFLAHLRLNLVLGSAKRLSHGLSQKVKLPPWMKSVSWCIGCRRSRREKAGKAGERVTSAQGVVQRPGTVHIALAGDSATGPCQGRLPWRPVSRQDVPGRGRGAGQESGGTGCRWTSGRRSRQCRWLCDTVCAITHEAACSVAVENFSSRTHK